MRKILGIDAGGTYTDGVVLNMPQGVVSAKTKTPTTHTDLLTCIRNCVGAFSAKELEELSLVCLSTTLATNALVEGYGETEGLLLIGKKPTGRLPTELIKLIAGKPDILGRIKEPLDISALEDAIHSFRGKVQAIAISGYASVRNPQHEQIARNYVLEKLGVPTVCAHELTDSLGFYDRTVTASLNARLIPVLRRLIDAVRQVLSEQSISAPLMIVRGDGTLMSSDQACERPIETVLSGPAASIAGGLFLSGEKDALILDMGGTTTDISHLTNGQPRLRADGANIGGWFTRVRAVEVYTVGFGGDSRIRLESNGTVSIGPERVIPYCVAAHRFPTFITELRMLHEHPEKPYLHFQQSENEGVLITSDTPSYDEKDKLIFLALANRPRTLFSLREQTKLPDFAARIDRLVHTGVLSRIALTPTDLLHVENQYSAWDKAASEYAIDFYAAQMNVSFSTCIQKLRESLYHRMAQVCLEAGFYFDGQTPVSRDKPFPPYYTELFLDNKSNVLAAKPSLKKKVVAIGAPSSAWTADLNNSLNATVICPLHAEVAGAIGAAVGQIIERSNTLIRQDPITKQYIAFANDSRNAFPTLEEATLYAQENGKCLALSRLPKGDVDIEFSVDDLTLNDTPNTFIERHVQVTVSRRFSEL